MGTASFMHVQPFQPRQNREGMGIAAARFRKEPPAAEANLAMAPPIADDICDWEEAYVALSDFCPRDRRVWKSMLRRHMQTKQSLRAVQGRAGQRGLRNFLRKQRRLESYACALQDLTQRRRSTMDSIMRRRTDGVHEAIRQGNGGGQTFQKKNSRGREQCQ